ncbi:MAG TPA: class I SAM-dependent methyltransferase, partial [Ignavibacteriaceae bacterium]
MEVKDNSPVWLNKSHPNFIRWKRAREISIERGKFVRSIITQQYPAKNLTVLDLGSGEGGTSKVFSHYNFVVSFDISLTRLHRQKKYVIPKDHANKQSESSICHFDQREKFKSLIEEDFSLEDSFEMTDKNLINGSALQLPFTNNSFDLIIIQDVIEHLSELNDF